MRGVIGVQQRMFQMATLEDRHKSSMWLEQCVAFLGHLKWCTPIVNHATLLINVLKHSVLPDRAMKAEEAENRSIVTLLHAMCLAGYAPVDAVFGDLLAPMLNAKAPKGKANPMVAQGYARLLSITTGLLRALQLTEPTNQGTMPQGGHFSSASLLAVLQAVKEAAILCGEADERSPLKECQQCLDELWKVCFQKGGLVNQVALSHSQEILDVVCSIPGPGPTAKLLMTLRGHSTKDKLEPTAFIASVLSGIELYNLPLVEIQVKHMLRNVDAIFSGVELNEVERLLCEAVLCGVAQSRFSSQCGAELCLNLRTESKMITLFKDKILANTQLATGQATLDEVIQSSLSTPQPQDMVAASLSGGVLDLIAALIAGTTEGDQIELGMELKRQLDKIEQSMTQIEGTRCKGPYPTAAGQQADAICTYLAALVRLLGPALHTICTQPICKNDEVAEVLLKLLGSPITQACNGLQPLMPSVTNELASLLKATRVARGGAALDVFSLVLDVLQHLLEESANTRAGKGLEKLQKQLWDFPNGICYQVPPHLLPCLQGLLPAQSPERQSFAQFYVYEKGEGESPFTKSAVSLREPQKVLEGYSYDHDGVTTMLQKAVTCKPACPYAVH